MMTKTQAVKVQLPNAI